jgi:hypothetical protein
MPLWFDSLMALRECCHKPFVLAGASMFAGHLWAMLRFKTKVPQEVSFWRNHGEHVGLIFSKARRAIAGRTTRQADQDASPGD